MIVGIVIGILIGYNAVSMFYSNLPLHLFLTLLFIFHSLEFLTTSFYKPKPDVYDYVLFHSPAFMIAFTLSMSEYYIELHYFPELKQHTMLSLSFGVITLFFQSIRSIAMIQCGNNFNHYIETTKSSSHILITDGIYKYLRHPSYFGWFYWSIMTQCVMLNPICVILYALAAWYFFYTRISYEEKYLVRMFGDQYVEYMKKTPVGIPFL